MLSVDLIYSVTVKTTVSQLLTNNWWSWMI